VKVFGRAIIGSLVKSKGPGFERCDYFCKGEPTEILLKLSTVYWLFSARYFEQSRESCQESLGRSVFDQCSSQALGFQATHLSLKPQDRTSQPSPLPIQSTQSI